MARKRDYNPQNQNQNKKPGRYASKPHNTDEVQLPKSTRIANNILDFGGLAIVIGGGLSLATYKILEKTEIPQRIYEFCTDISNTVENITQFIS